MAVTGAGSRASRAARFCASIMSASKRSWASDFGAGLGLRGGAIPFSFRVRLMMSPAFSMILCCQHTLMRLHSLTSFMLFQPTIELRGLSIGFEKIAAGLGHAESGTNHHAIGGAKP